MYNTTNSSDKSFALHIGTTERCCDKVRFGSRKCVKMRLRPELRPDLAGELTALPSPHSPDLLAGFEEGKEWGNGWKGVTGERNGRETERKGGG